MDYKGMISVLFSGLSSSLLPTVDNNNEVSAR